MSIRFAPPGSTWEGSEVAPGLILDYDQFNRVVGVEILGVRDLLATGRTPQARVADPAPYEPPPLQAALGRYARAFPEAGLPFVLGIHAAEGAVVAVALLDWAVVRGRPLSWWQIMDALGIQQPPDGAPI
jgi:hypothetical protein